MKGEMMNKTEVWIQFANEADYKSKVDVLDALFSDDGAGVVIYLSGTKGIKRLSERKRLNAVNCGKVRALVGDDNVKIVTKEKNLESERSFHFPDRPEVSLERIANALESINENLDVINSSLSDVSVSLNSMENNLNRCISVNGKSRFLCITGDVSTY